MPAFSRHRRPAGALVLALALLTCTDGFTGPGRGGVTARLALVPEFSESAQAVASRAAAFGLEFTNVRVVLVRPPADTLKDTVVTFLPGQPDVTLDLLVQVNAPDERFNAGLQYRSVDNAVLYAGTAQVQALPPSAPHKSPAVVPINYVGPGSRLARLSIAPRGRTLSTADSLPFTATAVDSGNAAMPPPALQWTVDQPSLADITPAGVLKPAGPRGTVRVRATAITGIFDTASVVLVPPPGTMTVVSGDGQAARAGTRLPTPFVVELRAADDLPVQAAAVTFSPIGGGGTADPQTVLTDAQGRASTVLTLGPAAGAQTFQAAVGNLTANVSASATAGPLAGVIAVTVPSDTVFTSHTLVGRVVDQVNNGIPGVPVQWSHASGQGTLGTVTTVSDATGTITAAFKFGSKAGPEVVEVLAEGAPGMGVFTSVVRPGKATQIAVTGASHYEFTAGQAIPLDSMPAVIVKDAYGNGVPGVTVAGTVTRNDTLIVALSDTTILLGVAPMFPPTAPNDPGNYVITAASEGLAGSPVVITVRVNRAGDPEAVVVRPDGPPQPDATPPVVTTLPEAIQLVATGGTIVVEPGDYPAQSLVIDRRMTIEGAAGSAKPILRTSTAPEGLLLLHASGTVALRRLDFRNDFTGAVVDGVQVFSYSIRARDNFANITIEDSDFTMATGGHASGLIASGGGAPGNSHLKVLRSTFTGGRAAIAATGGATNRPPSIIEIRDSRFTGHRPNNPTASNFSLQLAAPQVILTGNVIVDCGDRCVNLNSPAFQVTNNDITACGPFACLSVSGGAGGITGNRMSNAVTGAYDPFFHHVLLLTGGVNVTVHDNDVTGCGAGQCITGILKATGQITNNRITVPHGQGTRFAIALSDNAGGDAPETDRGASFFIANNAFQGTGGTYGTTPTDQDAYPFSIAAVLAEGHSTATVDNNSITGANAAFLARTGSTITGTRNTAAGLRAAVIAHGATAKATVRLSDFTGFDRAVEQSGHTNSDLTCNWWGSADGPTNASATQGPALYVPWATAPIAATTTTTCSGDTPGVRLLVHTATSATVSAGQHLVIPIVLDMSNPGGANVASIQFDIAFDPARFSFVSATNGTFGSVTANTSLADTSGQIQVNVFAAEGTTSSHTLYTVTLQAKPTGTTALTNVSASVGIAGNESGDAVTVTPRPLPVTINP